jgi:hypothetical protein
LEVLEDLEIEEDLAVEDLAVEDTVQETEVIVGIDVVEKKGSNTTG